MLYTLPSLRAMICTYDCSRLLKRNVLGRVCKRYMYVADLPILTVSHDLSVGGMCCLIMLN